MQSQTLQEIVTSVKNNLWNNNELFEKAAQALHNDLNYSPRGLVIKKYNLLDESIWNPLFTRAAEISKESGNAPIAYINFDEHLFSDYIAEDQTGFYKKITGTVLNAAKGTRLEASDEYKTLLDWFENDFSQIYNAKKDEPKISAIMRHHHNIGANIANLINYFGKSPSFDEIRVHPIIYNRVHPVVNISLLPSFEEGAVKTVEAEANQLIPVEHSEFQRRAQVAVGFVSNYMIGSKQKVRRSLATPGWTVDVLKYSWNNQAWNKTGFAEGATLEEMSYMKSAQL